MTPKPQSEQTFLLYINGIYLANFDMENRIQDNYALELSQSNNLYIGEVRKCQTNKLSVNILKYDESDLWWQWKVDKNEVEFK
jgi:DNA-binding transcriptional regulator WhiA